MWICAKHWRHVSRTKKTRLSLAYRRWDLAPEQSKAKLRWGNIWLVTFESAMIEAVEAAVGIA